VERLRRLVLPERFIGYASLTALLVVPWLDRTLGSTLAIAYVWALLALSYNVLIGLAGIASFGHAVPFGVAAFLTAIMLNAGVPYAATMICAALVAALAYTAVGVPAFRVRGLYYAILTLAVAEALRSTIESTARTTVAITVGSIPELTSAFGLWLYLAVLALALAVTFVSAVNDVRYTRRRRVKLAKTAVYTVILALLASASVKSFAESLGFIAELGAGAPYVKVIRFLYPINLYLLSLLTLYVSYLVVKRISVSPLGASLLAVRENPVRASVLGYNVFAHQLAAFLISGFFAGVAGSVYVALIPTVMTDVFSSDKTFTALVGTIVGGIGTLPGPIIGGILVGVLRDYLSALSPTLLSVGWLSMQQAQLLPSFLLGLLYVVVVLSLPYGIWGTWLLRGWRLKRRLEALLGGETS